MPRTTSNLAAFVFAAVLTVVTFQQAIFMPDAPRPAFTGYILA